ncbi:MAG: response regulator transcription factor [Saprospiraceae bacterium]
MQKPRILIVEDDAQIASLLNQALKEAGYETFVAFDGEMATNIIEEVQPRLVITDLMMPVMDGWQLCKHIREKKSKVPILMLTALGGSADVVLGLDSGADDYLVKPFRVEELLARVRALLRRGGEADAVMASSIAGLTVNHAGKQVFINGEEVTLTATEFRLLEFLLLHKGVVKSRMEILEHVWGMHFDPGTNVVDVYINYLRNKIDKHLGKKLIHTYIGLGFILKE